MLSRALRWNGSYPDSFGTGGYRTLYLLTGQQTTNTATVTHVGSRHYSPSLHRWLQRDPVGLLGGHPNPYVYAHGDPIKSADPTGLQTYQPRSAEQLLADMEKQTRLLAEHLEVYDPCDDPGKHHKEIQGMMEGLIADIKTAEHRKLATEPRFGKLIARGKELLSKGHSKLAARATTKTAQKVALRKLEKLLVKAGIKYTLHCVPVVNVGCVLWDVYDVGVLLLPYLLSPGGEPPETIGGWPSAQQGELPPPGGGSFYRPRSGWVHH